MQSTSRLLGSAAVVLLSGALAAQEPLSFWPGYDLTELHAMDGASKVKLVQLVKTPGAAHDGRLVVVYGQENNPEMVWEPKGKEHAPRDIFARFSDDEGLSWSAPVNLSQTANAYSARTDWNGDGTPETYWGDSAKPNIFNNGDTVVVSWVDKYCPEVTWSFGDSGESTVQGAVSYPDLDVYPNQRVVPYSGVYLAISNDGGTTWSYGGANPPLQLTYGRRDAIQDVHRGAGKKWVVTWQEDPEGLQPGEADGPGTGASGAKTTQGTDVWYSWTDDIAVSPLKLRDQRQPLTDHSQYDLTGINGFPLVGKAGALSNHGASRANLFLVNDGGVFKALCAYEETKGIPDVVEGKTVQYHAFPYDAPVLVGDVTAASGAAGTTLTPPLENARRVRFVVQPPDGVSPAIAVFWRQGFDTEGGPADIVMRVATSVDEVDVAAAPSLNMTTNTPSATMADLTVGTTDDPLEDARAHRALLRGDLLILGYTYTWNGPLARYTDLANYEFWIRRSLDGGQTWLGPQNVSDVGDTTINVKEPRLVGTPKTGFQNEDAFLVAYGTETNVYEGLAEVEPLDIRFTRTFDQGSTFDPVVELAATTHGEYELQIRPADDLSEVYAVWNDESSTGTVARYAHGAPRAPEWIELSASSVPIGHSIDLTLHSADHAGDLYQVGLSTGFLPGVATPYGLIPLNDSGLLQASLLPASAHFISFSGVLDHAGRALARVLVPQLPALQGAWVYTAFVVVPEGEPWAISDPYLIEIR